MAAGNLRRRQAAKRIQLANKKAAERALAKKRAIDEKFKRAPSKSRQPKSLPPVRHPGGPATPVNSVKGIRLPPGNLRKCGVLYKDDQYYKASAISEADRVRKLTKITASTSILDIGCGSGRLLYGLVHNNEPIGLYEGIDIEKPAIDWVVTRFEDVPYAYATHLDIRNERYNTDGIILMDDSFRLPFEDYCLFDVIYLYSVFTHLMPNDIRVYLREFKRLLKENGTIFLTIFCEKDVEIVEENPPNYPAERYGNKEMGPLHKVRYPYDYFNKLVVAAKLRIRKFDNATEWNGQSGMLLEHAL